MAKFFLFFFTFYQNETFFFLFSNKHRLQKFEFEPTE